MTGFLSLKDLLAAEKQEMFGISCQQRRKKQKEMGKQVNCFHPVVWCHCTAKCCSENSYGASSPGGVGSCYYCVYPPGLE